jgi:hypothetical protein
MRRLRSPPALRRLEGRTTMMRTLLLQKGD